MNFSTFKKITALTLAVFMLSLSFSSCTFLLERVMHTNEEDSQDTSLESESETDEESTSTSNEETEGETKEDTPETPDEDSNKKVLDLYLVAGQSNATGCTQITDLMAAYEFNPDLISGVSNVLYAGNSRSNSGKRDRVIDWQETTMWLGMSEEHFGPEAGMATALASYYNADTGNYAGIIKYAYGGSSLLNKTTGDTNKDGNWVSPSYQKTLSESSIVDGVTGQMYRNFLAQVETNVREVLNNDGIMAEYDFDTVRICGLYWMQGCQDKSEASQYEVAFKYFAQDIRNDLSKMMKDITNSEDDCGASEMPIIVGTISQTQNLTSSSIESVNKTFIALQKSFATKVENCYVVDNSAYAICKWENGKMTVLGSDQWHWNQADMLDIGKNVGDVMLEVATKEK